MGGYGIKFDGLGTPMVSGVGDSLPEVYPAGAPWMLLGGGGGLADPEYPETMGMVSGSAAAGLKFSAVKMTAGPADQVQNVEDWTVAAALFTAEGQFIQPLGVSVAGPKAWDIESPTFPPGPKRLAIIRVLARRPGAASDLRPPALLLVAGA